MTTRRSYLITLTTSDSRKRTIMRNMLWRMGAREVLPGVYWATLTPEEHARLTRQFGVRVRER